MVVLIFTSDLSWLLLSGSSSKFGDLFTDGHLSTGKSSQSASLRLKATCGWSLGSHARSSTYLVASSDWSLNRVRFL